MRRFTVCFAVLIIMAIGWSKENVCLGQDGSSLLTGLKEEAPVKYYHIYDQGLEYYKHPVKQEALPLPVKKQLEEYFDKEYSWNSNFIAKVHAGTLNFYAQEFSFKDKSFYILVGPFPYFSGTGGSQLYLYLKNNKGYKLIFVGFGTLYLSGSETNGFPDLVIYHHMSDLSGYESIYKWKDGEYLLFRKDMRYVNLFTDKERCSVGRIYHFLHQNLKERWKVEQTLEWLIRPTIDQKAQYQSALRAYFQNNPEGDATLIDRFVRDNKRSFVWDLLEAARAYEKTGNKDKAINLCESALKIADNDRQIQKIKEEIEKWK